jgi:hypothetical protein
MKSTDDFLNEVRFDEGFAQIKKLTKSHGHLGDETADLIYGFHANPPSGPVHVKGLATAYELSDNDALILLTRLAKVGVVRQDKKTPTAFHVDDRVVTNYVRQDR